jgi:hypothetical protein
MTNIPTDEEIRANLARKKAERQRSGKSDGHNRKVLFPILKLMEVGVEYPMSEVEFLIEKTGGPYTSAGPATTFGVRAGFLTRPRKAVYKYTGKDPDTAE